MNRNWNKTKTILLSLLLSSSAVGIGSSPPSQAQAIATVRAIINRNSGPCKINSTRGITAVRNKVGWQVSAKLVMSTSGKPLNETAMWTVRATDGQAVAASQLSSEIEAGCP